MSNFKKAFSVTVSVLTVLWSVGFAVAPVASQAAASAGDLVKMAGNSSVYYFDGTKRYVFPNQTTYMSWYKDFTTVKTIPSSELYSYPIGGNVTMRPGTKLVKITTDPKVYAVEPGGKLRWVTTEAIANALFGSQWAKRVVDVPDQLFVNYTGGSDITTNVHPTGTLVKYTGDTTLYYVDGGTKRPFASDMAVSANMEDSANAVLTTISYTNGTSITGAETVLTNVAGSSTGPVAPVAGNLSVALAADSPASGTLVVGQGGADLAHFTFTGTGTVTGLTFKRIGVSADATLSNVYLFDGSQRITDAASVSSGSQINFSNSAGLFTVNGTKTVKVVSDLAGTSGETLGVQLESAAKVVTSPASTVSGTYPMSGSLMSLAAATLATVNFGTPTGSGNSDPGTDLNIWQSTVTVGTRDVKFTRLALRQLGSIVSSDIKNFRLQIDGTQVAQADSLDTNGYVTFAFSKVVQSGGRVFKVLADVIGGSNRTVQLSLRGTYDVNATDSQYSAGITATATGNFPAGPASFTVNPGSMTVVKTTDSASQNVTVGASDVSLAKYTFTAYGETIKVENLRVGVITNTNPVNVTLRNVRLLANGSQVGSTTNVAAAAAFGAASGQQFTTNFEVVPGTPTTVEIRGDIFDTEGDNNFTTAPLETTVQALLVGGTGTSNGLPKVSLAYINVPSQNNVVGNVLTVASGSMSAAQTSNYGGQTVVVPQTAYKIASFNLTGNATEAVNINTLRLELTPVVGATFAAANLTDVYIKSGIYMTTVKGTVTASNNTWSVSLSLPKNGTLPVDVYATLGSNITATHSMHADLSVTGITTDSSTTVYATTNSNAPDGTNGVVGQTIVANTGSLTVSTDATMPDSALVDDSGSVTTGAWKFVAVNDDYTVTDITFTLANASAVANVNLKDGASVLVTKPAATTVTFNGLNVLVNQAVNRSKVLTVELVMSPVGVGAGTSGASILTTLTSATARSSNGTSAAVTESPADPAGNAMYVYKAVPTITPVALPTTVLTAGGANQTFAKFTISSNGTGTVSWAKLLFTISKTLSAGDIVTNATVWNSDSNTQVAGNALITGLGAGAGGSITFWPTTEQQINGSKTYELRADLAGTAVAGNTVTTNITQPSVYASSVRAYGYNTASGMYYADVDNNNAVNASDRRLQAVASVTAAGNNTLVVASPVNTVASTYGLTTAADSTKTITLTESAVDNVLSSITTNDATLTACNVYTAANGGGTTTTTISAILSIMCTGTNKQLIMNVAGTPANATANQVTIITLTVTDAGYANGSVVAATDSDVGLAYAGNSVLNAASLVWSDNSASAHAYNTTDWTNGTLVKNLPTSTQTLTK